MYIAWSVITEYNLRNIVQPSQVSDVYNIENLNDLTNKQTFCKEYVVIKVTDSSWFQTFTVFWMLYSFFWVLSLRRNFVCRHFGTPRMPQQFIPSYSSCLHHLWRCNRAFWNVGTYSSDAQELPKRKNISLNLFILMLSIPFYIII
jgi:hypothetical protein